MVGRTANRPVSHFVSNDLDDAVEHVSRVYFPHEIDAVGPRAFRMELTAGRVGAVTVGVLEYGCEIDAQADFGDTYNVYLPLVGGLEIGVGAATYRGNESVALVTLPGWRARVRGWVRGGERLALLKFDAHVLEAELRAMLGREVRGAIELQTQLDVSDPAGRAWRQISAVAINSLRTDDATAFNPLMATPLAAAITRALLLVTNHPYRAALDDVRERVRPRLVRRAVAIIDERAHEPLTVSGIAAEVGCSVRALRYGFQSHVGMSPAKYLARIRMDRVHHELLRTSPEDGSVSEVLYRWGISHPGRFAQAYRMEYGVLPSVTLRSR